MHLLHLSVLSVASGLSKGPLEACQPRFRIGDSSISDFSSATTADVSAAPWPLIPLLMWSLFQLLPLLTWSRHGHDLMRHHKGLF